MVNGGAEEFALLVRIPGWTRNEALPGNLYSFATTDDNKPVIRVNGEELAYETDRGYAVIRRTWADGDRLSLDMPMEPRRVEADERIIFDRYRFAVQRGPIVYCAEAVDNDENIRSRRFSTDASLTSVYEPSVLGGVEVVKLPSTQLAGSTGNEVTLIPYGLWKNRGPASLLVWLMDYAPSSYPDSLILLLDNDFASTNHVSDWESLISIHDLYDPQSSSDKGPGAFGNWRFDGGTVGAWNWVQYNFAEKKEVSSSEVYWWRDGAGINIPDSSYISYYDEQADKFIKIESSLKGPADILPDNYNKDLFAPVSTERVRLNFYGSQWAQGILEWKLYTRGAGTFMPRDVSRPDQLIIYPNPASESAIIEMAGTEEASLSVFTTGGRKIFESRFSNNMVIRRSDLDGSGIYILLIKEGSRVFSGRLVFR